MSNLVVYLIGFGLIMAGLIWAAIKLGVPDVWIMIGALVFTGLGLISAVSNTRKRESSPVDED